MILVPWRAVLANSTESVGSVNDVSASVTPSGTGDGDWDRGLPGPDPASEQRISRTRLSFDLDGSEIVCHLYHRVAVTSRLPTVVMGHGFSGTQDRLAENARRFAEAGLAVLTFDYRSFGESGGEPRQVVSVRHQLDDWRCTIRFARRLFDVDPDRIALWGSSLGGAHVVTVAAEDPRIAAVVAQVPFNGFPRRVQGRSTLQTLRLLWVMCDDAVRGWLGRQPHYIPMLAQPGELAVAATPRANDHLLALSGGTSDTLWRNQVAPRGLFGMLRYRPSAVAHRVVSPLLVCVVERELTPAETAAAIVERAPRGELRRYPGDHFDIYRDPIRHQALTDQVAFLTSHLQVEDP